MSQATEEKKIYSCNLKHQNKSLEFSIYKEHSTLQIKTQYNGNYLCQNKTKIIDKTKSKTSIIKVEMRLASHCNPELPDVLQKDINDYILYERFPAEKSRLHWLAFSAPSQCE